MAETVCRWMVLLSLGATIFSTAPAQAQEAAEEIVAAENAAAAPTTPPTLEEVNAKADAAALAGHNAWMLTCSALVLFMTAPGLAMFYGGLVRKKNVLSVMMQCVFLMGLMTVIWATVWLLAGVRRQPTCRISATAISCS